MRLMVVTFGYVGMTTVELEATSEELAPQFAAIPGCLEKTWMADGDANRCGGFYKFVDAASVAAYRASDLWVGVTANPAFTDFEIAEYDMIDAATAITGGVPLGASAG